ncbi:MAG: hypothetical protein JOZ15_22260 [Acidobacteria bacterium]|nr:hypothetical protein [Acidobacteriota bacterium]
MLPKHLWLAGVLARLAPALAAALLAGRALPLPAQNLLINPDFVSNLSGWQVNGQTTWDGTRDAEGFPNPSEGSAREIFDDPSTSNNSAEISQCVPLTVGTTYHLGGKIYIPAGDTASGGAFFVLIPFPTSDCSGAPPPGPFALTPEVTAVNSWDDSSTTFANSFAKSGLFYAALAPQSGGRLQANFDDVVVAPGAVTCTPDPHTLCLLGGRFRITVTFDTGGDPSDAQAVPVGDSGYFWFFNAANVEAFVKMIDGCGLGGHFWFFAAGLTNVHVVITVTDTQTGATQVYTNPANTAFQPVQDTSAFACP